MKKVLLTLITVISMLLCCVSCSSNKGGNMNEGITDSAGGYPSYEGKEEALGKENFFETNVTFDRKIIKTVNETLQTDDYDGLITEIKALVSNLGGYLSDANYSGDNYYNKSKLRYASMTIRIPAEKLSDFTGSLEGKAVVSGYNESIIDVTGDYIDVESRIAVLESEEIALLDMLSRSSDIDTLLSIRKSLSETQAELASLKAQKKDYDSRISYSTIYLRINEVKHATSNDPTFFEEVGEEFMNSLDNIGGFFRALGVFIIGGFLYIIIWGILIFALVLFMRRFIKKRKNKKTKASDENKPEENMEESE